MNAHARLHTARADAARLAALLGTELSAMSDFILALAAFDSTRGWAELGHASLFAFLVRHLHLSKSAAYHRAAAARLVREHTHVAEALRTGQLCLSSTAELAKVLTAENEADVLPRFFGLSAREAKELVAELAPHPSPPRCDVISAVKPAIPSRAEGVRTSEPKPHATPRDQGGSLFDAAPAATSTSAPARPADATVPLTADLRRLHMTVSRRFLQKLEAAREARSHARPNATTEALLEEALDLLLAREAKRRTAAADRPLPAPRPAESDHTPAHVRREGWARDEGRCQWPVDGGGLCGSTHRLQLDHTWPAARGGPPTAANLRILCEAHNKEAARRVYGRGWMERFAPGNTGEAQPRSTAG